MQLVPESFPNTLSTDFLSYLHEYKREGAYWGGIALRLGNIVAVPLIALLAVLVIGFINWSDITSANSSASLFQFINPVLEDFSFRKGIALAQVALVLLWWLGLLVAFPYYLARIRRVRQYFLTVLKMTDAEVLTTSWSDITHRIAYLTNTSQTHLHAILLRRDNFWIAIHSLGLLEDWKLFNVPLYNTALLRHVLNACVLNTTLTHSFLYTCKFQEPSVVRRRVVLTALGMLLLLPALLPFIVVYIVFRKAEEIHVQRTSVTQRSLSEHTKWLFREFNELEEDFEARAQKATALAVDYLAKFQSPVLKTAASNIIMVSGFYVGIMLTVAVFSENVLLNVSVWHKNLLWYTGIFSFIGLCCRALTAQSSSQESTSQLISRIRALTHSKKFFSAAGFPSLQCTLTSCFPYAAYTLALELVSIVCLPWFLLGRARTLVLSQLIDRLQLITRSLDPYGGMCMFSLFETPEMADTDELLFSVETKLNYLDVERGVEKMWRSIIYNHVLTGATINVQEPAQMLARALEREHTQPYKWSWTSVSAVGLENPGLATAIFFWLDCKIYTKSENPHSPGEDVSSAGEGKSSRMPFPPPAPLPPRFTSGTAAGLGALFL